MLKDELGIEDEGEEVVGIGRWWRCYVEGMEVLEKEMMELDGSMEVYLVWIVDDIKSDMLRVDVIEWYIVWI